ncbi:hypothetical protein SAMN05421874_12874 [Nonomuraea maritima]|uniref:Uncharacterized protein n=1 Tax=Nonomuraea maritima TaxID=683260 RepID=A0A1G9MK43_9ACTN|nr:hypothetical protein [Nonomuraea maritima]SDL74652.1 hypothetical protein SAMN05421874_12874 [Nonomuraea maritima]
MTTLTVPGTAAVRAGAADMLRTGGWIQGRYYSESPTTPGFDLVGAISLAAGLPVTELACVKPSSTDPGYLARWDVAQQVCAEIAAVLGRPKDEASPPRWLAFWNDRATLVDVLGALEGQAA